MSPHRHDCRVSQVISRRSEAPSAVRVFGDFPAVDLSDGGRSPRHGAVVRGQTQKFLTPAAKSFVAGTSLPWITETGCGRVCSPESPSAENRPQCGGRQAEIAAPSGAVALHTVRCAGSAASGATGENRRHNNGMRWSLVHHSRTGENRENSTTSTIKKSEISSLFHTYFSR